MPRAFIGTLLGLFVFAPASIAEDQLRVGMQAPTSIVANFFTGVLAEHGSTCPVLGNRDAVKVAIFAKQLNDPVLPLIKAVEEIVAADTALKWSFVFVSHENAPTPSQDEWDAQIAQLKRVASDGKIEHLSLGMMLRNPDNGQPSKAKRRLGFFGDGDIVVMLIVPDTAKKRGTVRYFSVLKSEELDASIVERVTKELKGWLCLCPGS